MQTPPDYHTLATLPERALFNPAYSGHLCFISVDGEHYTGYFHFRTHGFISDDNRIPSNIIGWKNNFPNTERPL